jgi:YegS/Rv2252/BmrU family lipid kinase
LVNQDNGNVFADGRSLIPRSVHVIINPAAGTEAPILADLNRVFRENKIDWEAFITKDAGDARRYAQESSQAGVDLVLACGGDGTVMETASGLRGSGVPMGILPVGTANVMSLELGIPGSIPDALSLVTGGENILRSVDMGIVNDREFMLRVGIGMEAKMILETPRESKNRLGNLAYVLSGISQIADMQSAVYTMEIDDRQVVDEGITLFIANSMNIGLPGAELVQGANVSDGLLDVVLVRRGDLPSLLAIATNTLLNRPENPEPIHQWQAREVRVRVEPKQPAEVDGEELEVEEFRASVVPQAITIVCPKPQEEE